jgi:putative transposase
LNQLPKEDYPVLDTFKFVSIWLNYTLDQSQTSMRSVFKRLNIRGEKVDISTFSKASKKRSTDIFKKILIDLQQAVKKKKKLDERKKIIFPLDSTVISLTSKLLWQKEMHQVKLFSGINLETGEPGGILIHFGQGHDSKYGDETIAATPENGVAVMDRGFCDLKRIRELQKITGKYFVLRVKNNMKIEMLENGKCKVGTGKKQIEERVVIFSDREEKTEFRLITNIPREGEAGMTEEEIGEIYIKRWQIELLWKFLKMHLKLDRLITKNENGIAIQIYSCLISYLILILLEISKEAGKTMLDKLRYLQAFMSDKISYVHWFRELVGSC